ncbi:MAG: DoxX family protein [Flavobacteriia bacterium]|nr:DoxX family protein [Flavobacteriia bacterium]
MKKNNIIYWTSTSILSFLMLFSAINYFTNVEMKNAFIHLGYPNYFRIELAFAKIIGVALLILPIVSQNLKKLAYFGFTITLISASISHLAVGDSVGVAIAPIIIWLLLVISYFYQKKINNIA